MKRNKIPFLIILTLLLLPLSLGTVVETEIVEVFSVSLLSPNTSAARNQWALLIENQLPKIGIGVSYHESTGWGNIAPRTWSYPLIDYDYIPTYEKGGYDILFVGYSSGFDWDPIGLFDTAGLIPYGDNFYQYSNPVYDSILDDYMTELNPSQQLIYAHQLQQILYEDLPSITLLYPKSLYGFKEGLTGIDIQLTNRGIARYEFWDDPADHMIKYAIPADLREWNCYVQESYFDRLWMQGVYGALLQRDQISHQWGPQIASDYSITSDGLDITVNIDPNAKFSDGSPVLAEDVDYSYELHMTPAVGSSDYGLLTSFFANNGSITPVGSDIVTFNLTDTDPFYFDLLSYDIIDKSEVEPLIAAYGFSIFNEVPFTGNVGDGLVKSCGPFILNSFSSVTSTAGLIPNPYYGDLSNGELSLLDELYFVFISGKDTAVSELISGTVDIIDGRYYPVIDDLTSAGVEGILVDDLSEQELALNMKHPVFGTGELTPEGTAEAAKYIRKAISHAVPRGVIVDQILEGLGSPGVSPCPRGCYQFDESLEPYVYDLDLAIDYMEAAGFDVIRTIYPTTPPITTTTPIFTPTTEHTFTIGFEGFSLFTLSVIGLTSIVLIKKRRRK